MMLNEIKEVEAYLCNPKDDNSRLSSKLLTENFKPHCKLNGIAEVLTLVASYYLYNFNNCEGFTEETREMTVLILRIWCGFAEDVSDEERAIAKHKNKEWFVKYPNAEGWLYSYHSKHITDEVISWSDYSNEWSDKLKSNFAYKSNAFCYDSILAQAVSRGRLKTYYLGINESYENVFGEDIKTSANKTPDARKRKTLIKLIAAYKLLQKFHEGQKSVLIQSNRILNWLGYKSDKSDRWCSDILWKNKRIITIESYKDYKKMSVDEEFLKHFDIKLLDNQPQDIPKGYILYDDNGHKNGLIRI